jgi:hypothetical protein
MSGMVNAALYASVTALEPIWRANVQSRKNPSTRLRKMLAVTIAAERRNTFRFAEMAAIRSEAPGSSGAERLKWLAKLVLSSKRVRDSTLHLFASCFLATFNPG